MMMNDLRSIKTNEYSSERTNINNKQDKLAARGSRLAANIEYRITNKKYKSIYSHPAVAYSATARLYRVVSKPGINKPHDRIVRQQGRILMNDLRTTATNEHSSERTNINNKQDKLAARGSRLAAKKIKSTSSLSPLGGVGGGLVANNKNHHAYAT